MPNSQTQSPASALQDDIPFDPVEAHRVSVNRENARKSTGPRSPEGKARSSQNALKHGLCAQAGSITATMPDDLEPILESFNKDFRPSGAHEEVLVRELALADWRLRLIARMESGFLGFHMQVLCEEETPGVSVDQHQDHDVSALMGIAWFNNQNLLALLVRYQNQARRAYYRALKELGLVRTGKADYLPPVNETAAASNATVPPEAGCRAASAQTNPPEQAKAAAAAAGSQTNPGSAPIKRTFTVTSRVLSPETGNPGLRNGNFDPMTTPKE